MPLKPCPPEYQALSDAMMQMHLATLRAENSIRDAIRALDAATGKLSADGVLVAKMHSKGYLPLGRLALIHSRGRAVHDGMSEVLQRLGYELPIIMARGPGGGR